ncbi:hypothetical protein BDZ89DRAFT_1075933 [Hymenopellis radicata]|nr:hypothetical protein BDZ89DRAFT_1075933 [Hymenopellis radicata]
MRVPLNGLPLCLLARLSRHDSARLERRRHPWRALINVGHATPSALSTGYAMDDA